MLKSPGLPVGHDRSLRSLRLDKKPRPVGSEWRFLRQPRGNRVIHLQNALENDGKMDKKVAFNGTIIYRKIMGKMMGQ